jgi:hypothetical protein
MSNMNNNTNKHRNLNTQVSKIIKEKEATIKEHKEYLSKDPKATLIQSAEAAEGTTIKTVDSFVDALGTYGTKWNFYTFVSANCQHFATGLFNLITGDKKPTFTDVNVWTVAQDKLNFLTGPDSAPTRRRKI